MSEYIDTRDLAVELDELERRADAVADFVAELDDDNTAEAIAANDELEPLDEDEETRLAALRELRDEIGSEWHHGETMIRVDQFEEYAEQLAEDIGAISSDTTWPLRHIDWAAAAAELAQDYTEVEWEGTSYYVRTS